MSELKTYTFVYDEIAKLIIIPVIFKTNNCMMKVKTLIDTGAAASYISSFVSTSGGRNVYISAHNGISGMSLS